MEMPFKNFKKADWIFLGCGIIILIILGLVLLGKNKFFYKTPVLDEKDITFTVFFRGVTITDNTSPFKTGENAFITIRNVPYTKLQITDVKVDRRKIFLETNKKGDYQPVDDISSPFLYDFAVTLKDKAKITDDGAVVGGNKVKMGIPVVIEGQKYKFTGVVSNIQIADEANTTGNLSQK
ncbi:DUF4330 domain-containing protein [bacterium]|nr:DUF4330 domain-containing protein [bacterium]